MCIIRLLKHSDVLCALVAYAAINSNISTADDVQPDTVCEDTISAARVNSNPN